MPSHKTRTRRFRTDTRIRKLTAAATVIVALSAAALSFSGLMNLGIEVGFHPYLAVLLPIAIDGTILVGMLGVLHCSLIGAKATYSWFLVVFGLIVSVWGNAVLEPDLLGRIVHGIAPILLALALEGWASTIRRKVAEDRRAFDGGAPASNLGGSIGAEDTNRLVDDQHGPQSESETPAQPAENSFPFEEPMQGDTDSPKIVTPPAARSTPSSERSSRRRAQRSPEVDARIVEMHQEGISIREIADATGVSPSTAHRVVKKHSAQPSSPAHASG